MATDRTLPTLRQCDAANAIPSSRCSRLRAAARCAAADRGKAAKNARSARFMSASILSDVRWPGPRAPVDAALRPAGRAMRIGDEYKSAADRNLAYLQSSKACCFMRSGELWPEPRSPWAILTPDLRSRRMNADAVRRRCARLDAHRRVHTPRTPDFRLMLGSSKSRRQQCREIPLPTQLEAGGFIRAGACHDLHASALRC